MPGLPEAARRCLHKEIDDPILAEVTRRERLVLGPKPLGDLAHGRPAQQPTSGFVRERVFDVARRQSACVELDRQVLERAGPTRQVLSDPRDERQPCREPAAPRTRPRPPLSSSDPSDTRSGNHSRRPSPLVALAPDLVPNLGFERLFHDQLRCQEHQVRTTGAVPSRPSIKARRRSRVLSGAATLFIGMLPAGPRRQTGSPIPDRSGRVHPNPDFQQRYA